MKVRKLVELLNDIDPSGNMDVVVGNVDILSVEQLPSYYDGCKQILVLDEDKGDYNVIGVNIIGDGSKINLGVWSAEDAIFEDAELPVNLDNVAKTRIHIEEKIEQFRARSRELNKKYPRRVKQQAEYARRREQLEERAYDD